MSASQHPPSEGAERILAAAGSLFAEHGFDAVSMNAVAERAGVSKANVFHHFGSKDALYLAVIRAVCRGTSAEMERFEADASTPVPQALNAVARDHLRLVLQHAGLSRLVLRDLLENGPVRGPELAQQVFGQNFSRLVRLLQAGQVRGELRDDVDPAMAAVLLIAADVFFFQSHDVLKHYPEVTFADQPERFSAMLVDLLLRGLLPRPSSAE